MDRERTSVQSWDYTLVNCKRRISACSINFILCCDAWVDQGGINPLCCIVIPIALPHNTHPNWHFILGNVSTLWNADTQIVNSQFWISLCHLYITDYWEPAPNHNSVNYESAEYIDNNSVGDNIPEVCLPSMLHNMFPFISSAAIDCGDPGTPTNGQRILSSTTYDSVVGYICDAGYIIQGSTRRTCLFNEQWSGSLPECSRECLNTSIVGHLSMHYGCMKYSITVWGLVNNPVHIKSQSQEVRPNRLIMHTDVCGIINIYAKYKMLAKTLSELVNSWACRLLCVHACMYALQLTVPFNWLCCLFYDGTMKVHSSHDYAPWTGEPCLTKYTWNWNAMLCMPPFAITIWFLLHLLSPLQLLTVATLALPLMANTLSPVQPTTL